MNDPQPSNRFSKKDFQTQKNNDPASQDQPQNSGNISFSETDKNLPKGFLPFALMLTDNDQILKTPFGTITISLDSQGAMADLAHEIQNIFASGITNQSLQKLAEHISALPEVQNILEQIPELKTFLEQTFSASGIQDLTALTQPEAFSPSLAPKASPSSESVKHKNFSFERFFRNYGLN